MTKKSRRTRNTPRLSAAQLAGSAETPSLTRAERAERVEREMARTTRVTKEDYSYVTGDLRRIAVLAVTFFAIMIILAIALPALHLI